MQRRVLVVEDEPSIADTLVYALQTEHFDVTHCGTGSDALQAAQQGGFDCLILDVGLPDISGFDVCRQLRQHSQVPVIFPTARDGEIDGVLGLELGGDDDVAKPSSPCELVARVRAILRRAQPNTVASANETSASKPTTLAHDDRRKVILCHGHALDLARNEYHLPLGAIAASRTGLHAASSCWRSPGLIPARSRIARWTRM